jgi:hypothetical protein
MRKVLIFVLFLVAIISLNAVYEVGDIIDQDYSWTDSNGEDHSIFELTESGKAVILFWGGYG